MMISKAYRPYSSTFNHMQALKLDSIGAGI